MEPVQVIERIADELSERRPGRADRGSYEAEAAVSLLIRPGPEALQFLAIQRTESEGDPWSGHMALPGGRREAGDESLWETAVRETREEVDVDLRESGRLLGQLDDVVPRSAQIPSIAITPFVFAVDPEVRAGTSREVERSVWLPVDVVVEERHRGLIRLEVLPEREFPTIEYDGDVIWGLTLRILGQFEEILRRIGYVRTERG